MIRRKINYVVAIAAAAFAGYKICNSICDKKIQDSAKHSQKDGRIIQLYHQWMKVKHMGKSVEKFLIDNNYNSIAIYGMGYLGKSLYNELKDSSINIDYIIDRNKDNVKVDCEVYSPVENLPETDLVIVTAIASMDEIVDDLTDKVTGLMSLEDIIYGMEYDFASVCD